MPAPDCGRQRPGGDDQSLKGIDKDYKNKMKQTIIMKGNIHHEFKNQPG